MVALFSFIWYLKMRENIFLRWLALHIQQQQDVIVTKTAICTNDVMTQANKLAIVKSTKIFNIEDENKFLYL